MGFLTAVFMTLIINLGSVPPYIELKGKNGSLVNGKPFSTKMIKEKVYIVFYVDPDVRDLNNHFVEKLKEQNFDKDKFGSIVIINMKATWLPSFILSKLLKEKQREFPDTIYVKDENKIFVKKWGLKDNDYNILLFDKSGRIIFYKNGKLDDKDIQTVINLIKQNIE